jgi:hypothetical protein
VLDGLDLSKTPLRWVVIEELSLKGTLFPTDTDHLIVRNCRCFLEAVLAELETSDSAPAHFARYVVPRRLARLVPEQPVELFNSRTGARLGRGGTG